MAMSTQQVALLAVARPEGASGHRASSLAIKAGANCAKANPGASFTWMWYRNPERLMSQSERLPS
jgi:hypothetical protein